MTKKKLKFLFITIPIAIIGAIILIRGVTSEVPPMGSDGWFDAESQKSIMCGFGGFILFFGIASTFITVVNYFSYKNWHKLTNHIPHYLKHTNKQGYCEYCNTFNNKTDSKCKSCGAPLKPTNNDTDKFDINLD